MRKRHNPQVSARSCRKHGDHRRTCTSSSSRCRSGCRGNVAGQRVPEQVADRRRWRSHSAARELRLGNATSDTIFSVARANVAANAGGLEINYSFSGQVSADRRSITVNLAASPPAGLGAAAGLVTPEINASATARVMGGAPVCAIGLTPRRTARSS